MSQPSEAAARAQLEKILASPYLKPSERLCGFLRFIVEKAIAGETGDIKEYTVGTAVYGRGDSFDPKSDSIVRVEASRLRTKLREYYANEGQADPWVVELPKGAYAPVFRPGVPPAEPVAETVAEPVAPVAAAPRSNRFVWGALAVAAVALIAIAAAWFGRRTPQLDTSEFAAVAVMPFLDLTPGTEAANVRLATGLAEDLALALANNKQLRVVSPVALGSVRDLSAARRQFKVASALEGSVRQEGGNMRVNLQLISTLDGYSLWSTTYDRAASAKLDLQRELATTGSREAGIVLARLLADAQGGASDAGEALGLFRQGTALLDWNYDHVLESPESWSQRPSPGDLQNAVHYFERAVQLNPRYARAHAALAQTYAAQMDGVPGRLAKMKSSAMRAVELDEKIAPAHAVLGYYKLLHEWDFAGAEREFKRALELQPRLLAAYRLYGDTAAMRGHFDDAQISLGWGALAFPESRVMVISQGVLLFHWRKYPEAERMVRGLLAKDGDYPPAHWLLGLILEQMGRRDEAMAEYERCLAVAHDDPRARIARLYLQARRGDREPVLAAIRDYETAGTGRMNAPYAVAMFHAGLGDSDRAFESLEKAYAQHDNSLPYVKIDPRFDSLRGDRRYAELIAKLGLR